MFDEAARAEAIARLDEITDTPPTAHCGERTTKMPRRRRTRAQDRAARIATERRHNRQARLARKPMPPDYFTLPPPTGDEEPPPF